MIEESWTVVDNTDLQEDQMRMGNWDLCIKRALVR